MTSAPMSQPEQDPREWLRFARSDLAAARVVRGDPDVLPCQVTFHAQQAAEKAIKAVLVHDGQPFPFTHDLSELIWRVERAGRPWPEVLQDVETLTPFAAQTRYPSDFQQPSQVEVDQAIQYAQAAWDWAAAIVNPQSAPSAPADATKPS